MFTMCNAALTHVEIYTATARRHWTEQWRHEHCKLDDIHYQTEL